MTSVLANRLARTQVIIVTAFWMEIFLLTYFVGWGQPPSSPERASGVMPFFLVALASAAAGFLMMFRLFTRREGLTPAVFQSQLLVGLALLTLPTLLGIFVVGSVRYEPMPQILLAISAIGIPLTGYGNLVAYWRGKA